MNPYDELEEQIDAGQVTVGAPPAPDAAGNPYDALETDIAAQREARIQGITSLFKASLVAGKDRANILKLATETGIHPDTVEKEYPRVERAWRAAGYDAAAFVDESPDLADLFLRNPQGAQVAMQDEQISGFTRIMRATGTAAAEFEQRGQPGVAMATAAAARPEDPLVQAISGDRSAAPASSSPPRTLDEKNPLGQGLSPEALFPAPQKVPTIVSPLKEATGLERLAIYANHWSTRRKQAELSALGARLLWYESYGVDSYDLEKKIVALEQEVGIQRNYGQGPVEQLLLDAEEGLASNVDALKGKSVGYALSAGIGTVAGVLSRSPKAGADVALRFHKLVGGKVGDAAAFLKSFEQESGQAYLDLRKQKTDDGRLIDPEIARGAAVVYGLAAAGVEVAELNLIFSKTFGPLGDAMKAGSARGFLRAMVSDQSKATVLRSVGKAWVQGILGEGTEEAIQQTLQSVIGWGAQSVSAGQAQSFDWSNYLTQTLESFYKGGLGGAALGAGSSTVNYVSRMVAIQQAQRNGALVAAVAKLPASPTAQAAPKLVADLVVQETAKVGQPVENMYVDAPAFTRLFEGQGVAPDAAARELMGEEGPARLREAIAGANGGRLEVGLQEYLSRWGNKGVAEALAGDTAVRPGAMTLNEQQALLQENQAAIEKRAEELVAQYDAAAKDGAQVEPDSPAAERLTAAVQRDLIAARVVNPRDARTQLATTRAFLETQAASFGIPAEVLFENYATTVERKLAEAAPAPAQPPAPTRTQAAAVRPAPPASAALAGMFRQMTPQQRVQAYYRDATTGALNERAFHDLPPDPGRSLVGRIAVEGVKWLNDQGRGHGHADELYRAVATAMAQVAPYGSFAKVGGDFLIHVRDQEDLDRVVEHVRQAVPGFAVTAAIGEGPRVAGQALETKIAEERTAGRMAPRGQRPLGVAGEAKAISFRGGELQGEIPGSLAERIARAEPGDLAQEAYVEPRTGLLTLQGWESIPRKKHRASVDMNGLRALNAALGREFADAVLEMLGATFADQGAGAFDMAHLHGDEYAAQSDNPEELRAFLERLRAVCGNVVVREEQDDGSLKVREGLFFAYGTGDTDAAAEEGLQADKQRLTDAGQRGDEFDAQRTRVIPAEEVAAYRAAAGQAADLGQRGSGEPGGSPRQDVRSLVRTRPEEVAARLEAIGARLDELHAARLTFHEGQDPATALERADRDVYGPTVNFDAAESLEAAQLREERRQLEASWAESPEHVEGTTWVSPGDALVPEAQLTPNQTAEHALSREAQALAERIADALEEPAGPAPDAEVVPPPGTVRHEQAQNLPEWELKVRAWMENQGRSAAEIERHLAAIRGQMAIFAVLGPVELKRLPRGAGKARGPAWTSNPEKAGTRETREPGGPLRENQDDIYVLSFDLSAMCVKRLEAAATLAHVQKLLNERAKKRGERPRALDMSERMALAALFREAGKTAPCLYCYVEAPRAKSGELVDKALRIAFGEEQAPETWSEATRALATAAIAEVKQKELSAADVDPNYFTDPTVAGTPEGKARADRAPALYAFARQMAASVTVNKPKPYEEYAGQILDVPESLIEQLNGYAGFRFFSSSDFQFEHVADLMQAFFDLSLRNAKSHAYTKVADYVRIFGATGQKIQTSIFAKEDGKGGFVEDSWQGMAWAEAKALRRKFGNVGTVLVATTDEQVRWGLDQDWVDYIIPFHHSGLESRFFNEMGWKSFQAVQTETWDEESPRGKGKTGKPEKIRMWELRPENGISDEELTRRYLKLCKERGIRPVFSQFADHPRFGKLKKDYARTDTAFRAVRPIFDLKAAKRALDAFFAGQAPEAAVDKKIAAQLVKVIDKVDQLRERGMEVDAGVEALRAMNQGRPIVETIRRLHQGPGKRAEAKAARAWVDVIREGMRKVFKVTLDAGADASSYLHETAHTFLEMMGDLSERPDAPQRIRDDYAKALAWLGAPNRAGITEEMEERWSRAFEAYLMEGKAPSAKLAGAFQQFRLWLLEVYRSITALNVQLDDNIRGVFDRMLATDVEIEQAKRAAGLDAPLFRSPDEAGMTPEQYQRYLDDREKSFQEAVLRTQRKVMADRSRATEAWWKRKLAATQTAAEADYDRRPDVQAQAYLRRGELTLPDGRKISEPDMGKLDRTAVEQLVGPAGAEAFRGRLLKQGGEMPDDVAQRFGFANGRELLEAVQRVPDREEWTTAEAERRMQAEHPDIYEERGRLREEAARALHNQGTSDWLLKEWVALRQQGQQGVGGRGGVTPLESIRLAAQIIARRMKLRGLSAYRILEEERRAAEQAAIAAARGDYVLAAVEKQRQLLQHMLYNEVSAAREERQAFAELLSRLADPKRRGIVGRAGQVFKQAVDQILEAMGELERERDAEVLAARRPLPDVMKALEDAGIIPGFAGDELSRILTNPPQGSVSVKGNMGDPWMELTVAEMRTVASALTQLYVAARDANTVLMDEVRRSVDTVAQDILGETKDRKPAAPGSNTAAPKGYWAKQRIEGFNAALTDPEVMLRELGPTAYKFFWDGYLKCRRAEDELATKVLQIVSDLWDALPEEMQRRRYDLLEGVEQALPFPADLNRDGRLRDRQWMWMLALNMGNRSNMERLLGGYQWNEKQVRDFLERNMTEEEWTFVEGVWKLLDEELWPKVAKAYEQVNGVRPEKIEALPWTLAGGRVIRGGYFPARYDPVASRVGQNQEADALQRMYASKAGQISVAKSFTKERVKTYEDVINLQWGAVPSHIANVVHYVTFDRFVRDAARVITHGTTATAIQRHLGDKYLVQLKAWLRTVATAQNDAIPQELEDVYYPALELRSRFVMSTLGYSLSVALGDLTNPLVAIAAGQQHGGVGARYMTPVLLQAMRPVVPGVLRSGFRAIREQALAKSPELRHRADNIRMQLRRQLSEIGMGGKVGTVGHLLARVRDTAWFFMEVTDKLTATVIWEGGYRQALARGLSEEAAIRDADARVRAMLPTHEAAEQPAFLRDKRGVGALVAFYGYFSKLHNVRRRIWEDAYDDWADAETTAAKLKVVAGRETAAAVGRTIAMFAVANLLGELLSGRGPDEDEKLPEWILRKMAIAPFLTIPLVGTALEPAVNAAASKLFHGHARWRSFSMRASPAAGAVERLAKAIETAIKRGEPLDYILGLLEVFGLVARVPLGSSQVTRSTRYLLGGDAADDITGGEWDEVITGPIYGEREHQPYNALTILTQEE